MQAPEDQPRQRRRSRLLIAVIVTIVIATFVVVHLTGVIGPRSH
jgi:hypothetical protein